MQHVNDQKYNFLKQWMQRFTPNTGYDTLDWLGTDY